MTAFKDALAVKAGLASDVTSQAFQDAMVAISGLDEDVVAAIDNYDTLAEAVSYLSETEADLLAETEALASANEALVTSILSTIEAISESISENFEDTSSIDKYNEAMSAALSAQDNETLLDALTDVSKYSGALTEASNFATREDMLFAQAVAASQLGGLTGFSSGGFTGSGSADQPAGVVHAGEWVAPKWMVSGNAELFRNLESSRKTKGFQSGGFTSSSSLPSDEQIKTNQYLFVVADEIKRLNLLFRSLSNGGNAMRTELVA